MIFGNKSMLNATFFWNIETCLFNEKKITDRSKNI